MSSSDFSEFEKQFGNTFRHCEAEVACVGGKGQYYMRLSCPDCVFMGVETAERSNAVLLCCSLCADAFDEGTEVHCSSCGWEGISAGLVIIVGGLDSYGSVVYRKDLDKAVNRSDVVAFMSSEMYEDGDDDEYEDKNYNPYDQDNEEEEGER